MKAKTLLLLLCTALCLSSFAQKEWSNWYFGGNNLMTFRNNNTPEIQRNFITPIPTQWWNYYYNYYRGSAYSDPLTGEMKFLLAGRFAYDRKYDIIEKSMELRVCPGDKYSFHIIPFPGNPDKFYVIQHQSVFADLLAAQSGLQVRCPNAIGLGYSVLDLSLNGGLGDFTSINNVLRSGVGEGIALIRHGNGKDVWVVVHSWGDNKYWAYLFTATGVQPPVISAIGPEVSKTSPAVSGNIVSTHDGRTIAAQIAENHFIELYDFDNNTGSLSNYRTLPIPSAADDLLFSPDDSKLYFLGAYWTPGVYQFDFNAPDIARSLTRIADDPSKSMWDMQLGPDGKIYIVGVQSYDPSRYDYDYFLPVISCPNLPKYACNYTAKGFRTPYSYGQFPNFINDYIQEPKAPKVTEFSLGRDTAICFGTFKLSAPEGWQYYRWNTGATTREITISAPGLYYVLAGDEGFSCPTAFGSINVANAARPLDLGKDTVLCPKTSYTLKVPPNFTHLLWNDGTSLPERQLTTGGRFSLRAEDENGCTNWDTISVSFKFDPRALFGPDTTLCNDQSLLLQLEPRPYWFGTPPVYTWQDGTSKDTFRVTRPGTYWGRVTYQGCTVSDTITVSYVRAGGITLGKDTTLCTGDSLRLGASIPGATYLWSTGQTTPHITVRSPGSYWLKVNNGSCSITDTITINVQPKPTLSLGADTTLCERQTLSLQASIPGATYQWQDGSTNSIFLAKGPGLYWAKATLQGCSNTDSILVSYKPLPVLDLGRDTGICEQQSLLLSAAHPTIENYLWQDGTVSNSYLVTGAGNYSVMVSGKNGCIHKDTITIRTNPLPVFSLGGDTTLCELQTLPLTVSLPGAAFLWSTGHQTPGFTITQPGVYWLEVAQGGCRKRDSISVAYKPLPNVRLGGDTILCEGSALLLDASAPEATYQWQDRSTAPRFQINAPGLYHVAVTRDGCVQRDSIQVAYRYKPRINLGRDTTLCMGQRLTLAPGVSGARLLWQDGSTAPSFTVQESGRYSVTATNSCGSTSDEILVANGVCRLYLPNAFTPNKDGLNDVFRVKDPSFIQTFKMTVYNRWGEIVFHTTDPNKGWDGRYKGLDQPEGNYVWMITLTTREGKAESGQGNVLLLR